MILRQSSIKTFQECGLKYRFQNLDQLPREQSGALTFGTLVHEAVMRMEQWDDLDRAIAWFKDMWMDPEAFETGLKIDYMLPRTSWKKYLEEGVQALTKWHGIYQWDTDTVLAREHQFTVPVEGTDHYLTGTIDRLSLRYMGRFDEHVVLIQDYKTNSKLPTYNYLQHDLQFTAYAYATTRPEFWTNVENGDHLWQTFANHRRWGEWIHLRAPKRMDAGERTETHYARLRYAVNAIASSIELGIFVPNISGEACTYCDFRKACGLPTLEQEGYLDAIKTPG